MNILKNISIKRKFFILTITVFSVSILAVATYSAISFMRSSMEMAKNTAEILNENHIEKINAEIQKGISLTKYLSMNLNLDYGEDSYSISNDLKDVLFNFLNVNSKITDLFILLNDSEQIEENISDTLKSKQITFHKSNDDIVIKLYNERDYKVDFAILRNLKKDQSVFVSNPFWLKYTESEIFVISIAAPVYIKDKKVGVLGINFSLSGISDIINTPIYNTKKTSSILLAQNNDIIFITEKPWLSGKNIMRFQGYENEIYNGIKSNNNQFSDFNEFTGAYNVFKINETNANWELITTVPFDSVIKNFIQNIYISILIASCIMIIGLFVILIFIRKSFTPFIGIIKATEKISSGEPTIIHEMSSKNEFGKIISNINTISENLKEASDISSKIASGDFENRLKPKSKNDILSLSINRIANNLKQSVEDSKIQEQETNKQLWMRRGRFEVSEAERISSNEISDLSFNLIRELVNYTDALLGGLYLYDNEELTINLISAYAYGNKKLVEKEFKVGEGLVGACVVEKKKILLSKIPEDYIKVSSGLGSGIPGFLVIIPVFFQEKINSVIEIAFIKQPEDYVIKFIEQLSDNIGAWIDASLINSKTSKLLEISREQTKKLADKEEELNKKVLELQKIQDEIAIQNAEYESMLKAVNHSVMTVEYTNEGIVINANEIYSKTMGFDISDIKGNSVLDLVKDQKENLVKIIKDVNKGNIIKRQVKRYTKNGEVKWLSATYTPFYSREGNVERILFFAFDISDLVK